MCARAIPVASSVQLKSISSCFDLLRPSLSLYIAMQRLNGAHNVGCIAAGCGEEKLQLDRSESAIQVKKMVMLDMLDMLDRIYPDGKSKVRLFGSRLETASPCL